MSHALVRQLHKHLQAGQHNLLQPFKVPLAPQLVQLHLQEHMERSAQQAPIRR